MEVVTLVVVVVVVVTLVVGSKKEGRTVARKYGIVLGQYMESIALVLSKNCYGTQIVLG